MAKLPSQNPLATRLRKAAQAARAAEDRKNAAASAALQRGAVERGNREQAREDREYEMVFKKKPTKKYAKGGSVGKADGCAKKGKTHTKMVKMAMGGMTGYKRGGKTC
jgi:hypothetical protein